MHRNVVIGTEQLVHERTFRNATNTEGRKDFVARIVAKYALQLKRVLFLTIYSDIANSCNNPKFCVTIVLLVYL